MREIDISKDSRKLEGVKYISEMLEVKLKFDSTKMETSRGREARMVYRSIYRPAWRRSGWLPQPKISIKVGISDASKKI